MVDARLVDMTLLFVLMRQGSVSCETTRRKEVDVHNDCAR